MGPIRQAIKGNNSRHTAAATMRGVAQKRLRRVSLYLLCTGKCLARVSHFRKAQSCDDWSRTRTRTTTIASGIYDGQLKVTNYQ